MSRVWKFGNNIDTDLLAPGLYMKGPLEELAKHCLESVDENFASKVQKGDIIVAGKHFGMGSSREQAAQVLRILGIDIVLAQSFGGIFYRNAFNLGLAAIVCPETDKIRANDKVSVDIHKGQVTNLTTAKAFACEPVPQHLQRFIEAGGLVAYLEQRKKNKDIY